MNATDNVSAAANSQTVPSKEQKNPFDKTVLLSLTVKMLGVSRKVDTKDVEVQADKDLLRVSKKILECDEYDAISKVAADLKKYLKLKSVPGVKFIKGGIYPIPLAKLEDIDAKVVEYVQQYEGKVTRFLEVYEARAEEGRKRLEVLADSSDYPTVAKVKASFGITSEYVTLGPPGSLQNVSDDIWKRESEKIRQQCMDASEQVREAMRAMFAEMVEHMIRSCSPKADGSAPKMYDTTLTNLKDFIDNFSDRNITDDAELEGLVLEAKNIMAGKTMNALRKDQDLKSLVKDRMAEVKKSLDFMLMDKPTRAIELPD